MYRRRLRLTALTLASVVGIAVGSSGCVSPLSDGAPASGGASPGGVGSLGGGPSSAGASGGYAVPCGSLGTQAGPAPTTGGACAPTDAQLCYKTCGPMALGFEAETCTDGAYAEGDCQFPADTDLACFTIPETLDPSCPTTPPQSTMPCAVAPCVPCNADGTYLDSTGTAKLGYCICPAPGASGISRWSCAPVSKWPCPGPGC